MTGPKQRLRIGAGKAGREPNFFVKKYAMTPLKSAAIQKIRLEFQNNYWKREEVDV